MSKPDDDGAWHLDRRVPIALILTLMIQTGGALWWAATATARLEQVEKRIEMSAPVTEKVIRVETKLEAISEAIQELKLLLRQRRGDLP